MNTLSTRPAHRKLLSGLTAAGFAFLAGACNPALSASLTLSSTPLYLTPSAKPNLIMTVDDSGSMDGELLLPSNDGAAWWRTANAADTCTAATGSSFVGCVSSGSANIPSAGQLNFNHAGNADGTWKKFVYLFPNGCDSADNSYRRRYCDGTNDHYAIPPLPSFAWARSPTHNPAYFNPAETYALWADDGTFVFTNSSPTFARFDPVFGTSSNAISLVSDIAGGGNEPTTDTCNNASLGAYYTDWSFRIFTGMVLPIGTCVRTSGGNWTLLAVPRVVGDGLTGPTLTNDTNLNIRYYPAVFYLPAATPLPASYSSYLTTAILTGYAPNGTALNGYEIKAANFTDPTQYADAIQSFANWFTYYRKRHLALRAGMGQSFATIGGMRVAGFRINDSSANVTMRDLDNATDKSTLYTDMYQNWVRTNGTPNRAGVANIVRNLKRTDGAKPIQYACQQNFGMLFTDGFSNPPATGDGFDTVGNLDGAKGSPYQDNVSNTMADGVMGAYDGPLLPAGTFTLGRVRPPLACSLASPPASLDCNTNLHMNFFAITLGAKGTAFDPNSTVNPYVTPPTWPTTFPARHPNAVDDIWHATINGRGALLNANSPSEIATKLGSVLNSISDMTNSSASSAAVNSGSINTDSRVYQARFDTRSWEGQLLSFPINIATGALNAREWDAGAQLPDADDRKIITRNTAGTAVSFRWSSFTTDTARKGELDGNVTIAEAKLNYLRGAYDNEFPNGYDFRRRPNTKLGDIVNSSPTYVSRPGFRYRDNLESGAGASYSAFVSTHNLRTPMIYAGANDGMLHAFDAETGAEAFAYIPGKVFRNLSALTSPTYSHRFYVDGTPQVGDVFFGSAWHTMLVGGLNSGGQGIYALDITDPDTFTNAETSPATIAKWEFTDANDADLGYTFSQPQIVRLRNGVWAAVFGNGYNNREVDGNRSSTGQAALYIVNIATGALIKKIPITGLAANVGDTTTPNGLATPVVVDLNGDRTYEYAYAGDLFGNLWKFDLSSNSPANWGVSLTNAGEIAPLFVALDSAGNRQPITQRPVVIRGPNGAGMAVLFGTGKYLEAAIDNSLATPRTQTMYGIYDANTIPVSNADIVTGRASLQQQTILAETIVDFDGAGVGQDPMRLRATSATAVADTSDGWYLDLLSPSGYLAEKSVSNPIVRDGRLIFTTLVPNTDPCSDGGYSWLMELNALTGGRLDESPFDLNGDRSFNTTDYMTLPDGTRVPTSALQSTEGILPRPGILADGKNGREYLYTPGTSGNILRTEGNPGRGGFGRQSWRQVR